MSGLLFKSIPKEGFDANSNFSERTSNPTPSRRSSVDVEPLTENVEHMEDLRLSHPMKSSRGETTLETSIDSRASNPTPTRRGTISSDESYENESRPSNPTPRRCKEFDTPVMTNTASFTPEKIAARASNPTPTRRRCSDNTFAESEESGSLSFASVESSYGSGCNEYRNSNPTPTRRSFDMENAESDQKTFDDRFSNYTSSKRK